jgi:hypothetical protein
MLGTIMEVGARIHFATAQAASRYKRKNKWKSASRSAGGGGCLTEDCFACRSNFLDASWSLDIFTICTDFGTGASK